MICLLVWGGGTTHPVLDMVTRHQLLLGPRVGTPSLDYVVLRSAPFFPFSARTLAHMETGGGVTGRPTKHQNTLVRSTVATVKTTATKRKF